MNKVFDSITNDMEWRLLELKEYENIIINLDSATNYEAQTKIILRSALPIIYAHWEGFIVSSLKTTLKYLNDLNLNNKEYCFTYLTTAYEGTLNSLDDSNEFNKRKKHLTNLCVEFDNKVKFSLKVDTKSNLNFKVLSGICQKTKLDITNFNDYKTDINKLLEIRNSIAHGENAHVFSKYSDIELYIDLLENLMLNFKSEIEDLLKNEKYKKDNNNEQSI